MEDDSSNGRRDANADFQKMIPDRGGLKTCLRCLRRGPPHFLHQNERRGRQQDPELVGKEPTATGPSEAETVVEFLDPVLDVRPAAVDVLVQRLRRRVIHVRDDEPRIALGPATFVAQHLGFDDDPALAAPGFGTVGEGAIDAAGLVTCSEEFSSALHEPGGLAHQTAVLGHPDDVQHVGLFGEEVEDLRCGEAAIEPHEDLDTREGGPESRQDPGEHPDGAVEDRCIAGPQERGTEVLIRFVVKGQERDHRQVAPGVVVAVEERELLGTVGRVVGRIQIDGDPATLPAQSEAVMIDDRVQQGQPEPDEISAAEPVLKPGDRRLGSDVVTGNRIAVQEELVDGITGQPGGIVAIRVTAGQTVDPLAEEFAQGMGNLAGLAVVGQHGGETIDQPDLPVRSLQEKRTTVRTGVGLVKEGVDWLGKNGLEKDTLCRGRLHGQKASVRLKDVSTTPFYHIGAFLLGAFVNYPV